MGEPRDGRGAGPAGHVLVVGGGPAGLRAALELADLGASVTLVEREPAVGGTLTQLDVQYPTLDCGACRMLESASGPPWPAARCLRTGVDHPLVTVLASSRLVAAERLGDSFEVRLEQAGRWIDPELCRGCGECARVCPVVLPDRHDCGLRERKASYRRHAQAQPPAHAIDEAACTRCGECLAVCPSGAIELGRAPIERELRFGAIVLATGFASFDPALQPAWAHGRHPDVLTALELERWVSPLVQTGGEVRRRSDGGPVRQVAFVQCVGSRDEERPYCSAICCMHALKEAIVLRERLGVAEVDLYAIDLRPVGKGYGETAARAAAAGVRVVHARPGAVEVGDRALLRVELPGRGQQLLPYDLVVLSVGVRPPEAAAELAALLGLELDPHGFVAVGGDGLARTSVPGVFAAGGLTGPRDIPWSVVGASEAALLAAAHAGLPPVRGEAAPAGPALAELARPEAVRPLPEAPAAPRRLELSLPEASPVAPRALVLGAGPAGLAAALALAEAGRDVTVVERAPRAGGTLLRLGSRLRGTPPARLLEELLGRLEATGRVELLLETELVSHRGGPGAHEARLRDRRTGAERTVRHGALVVATGAREHDPRGLHLRGEHPAVLTQLELEERLAAGGLAGSPTVVMIQCAGSRTAERPACSRVCCQQAAKNAIAILERAPEARLVVLHRDLRTVGRDEEAHLRARAAGALFVRVRDDAPPRVEARGEGLTVRFDDPLVGRPVRVEADLVVLSSAVAPSLGSEPGLAAALGLELDRDGLVVEASSKWRPVEAARRGLFVAGAAVGPVLVEEAMAEGRAAASRAIARLGRERLEPRAGAVAYRPALCSSCGLCVAACPSGARELDPDRGAAVHPSLCQGCGACAAACPSGTTDQPALGGATLLSTIDECLEARQMGDRDESRGPEVSS